MIAEQPKVLTSMFYGTRELRLTRGCFSFESIKDIHGAKLQPSTIFGLYACPDKEHLAGFPVIEGVNLPHHAPDKVGKLVQSVLDNDRKLLVSEHLIKRLNLNKKGDMVLNYRGRYFELFSSERWSIIENRRLEQAEIITGKRFLGHRPKKLSSVSTSSLPAPQNAS